MKGALIGLAMAGICMVVSVDAQTFFGFRLLDLDGRHVKWSALQGNRAEVTYAVVAKATIFPDARNCAAMEPMDAMLERWKVSPSVFRAEVKAAFEMWEMVADIDFREVEDPAAAQILIGAQSNPEGRAFADVRYVPGEKQFREIDRSLICLNPTKPWKVGFDGNLKVYDVRYTMAHEIGHAIGLDHPEPSGQVMSHRYQESFRSLQVGDVKGAVQIYGTRR